MQQSANEPKSIGTMIVTYFRDFGVLRQTRSEYWGTQIVNFLDCTIFFAILTISPIILSENFGFTDAQAGYVVTIFGSTTTICLLFSGMFMDWLGIRWSLYLAMPVLTILRAAIAVLALNPDLLPDHRGTLVTLAYFLMAPCMALVQTVFQAANKRFTTQKSRSAGFNLWYLFMNVGAALAGVLIDVIYLVLRLPRVHIFSLGAVFAVLCFVVTLVVIRREEQLYGPDEAPDPRSKGLRKNPFEIVSAVMREPVFWRFVCLVSLLLGVRAVFLYMHLLWPKYWLRVIGPDALIGTLNTINPILVIVGLILLIPILHRFSVYKMLVYGSIISALSLFVMAIPSWGNTTYTVSIIAIVVLSIGELLWSPRLTEYTAAIAPVGQEGTYLGLSMVPYFFAKTAVSFFSGHMLAIWVPELPDGELLRDRLAAGEVPFYLTPSTLWLLLGVFALAGPLVALALKGWFTKGAKWTTDASATDHPVPVPAAEPPATTVPAAGAVLDAGGTCPSCGTDRIPGTPCPGCGRPPE
jgi:MFS family permease